MHGVVDAQAVSRHGYVITVHLQQQQQSCESCVAAGSCTDATKTPEGSRQG